jgi:S-DNA-T family DNA segregation ATPase FtsK/SpoIIIE
VAAVRSGTTSAAPTLGLLPRELPYSALVTGGPPLAIPIGIGESALQPITIDFTADPHLVVYADVESGKTNLMSLLLHQITTRNSPEEVRVIVADYRRGLIEAADNEHVISYAGSEKALTSVINQTVEALRERLPGPDVTAEQLRDQSWWRGSRLFVLVDDYDLVAGSQNPLLPLVDLLGQARDVHLHLVVARRSGGAGRAMFDPVLSQLRDLASPGLVMSGSRDEGPLVGDVKPGPQPPGRGWLVRRRGGKELVQVALAPGRPAS